MSDSTGMQSFQPTMNHGRAGTHIWSFFHSMRWFPLLLFVLLVASCAGKETEPPRKKYLVKEIEFQGVKRFENEEILDYLYMGETSFWRWTGFTDSYYYSKGYGHQDAQRLKNLYHAYGYFQAEVTDVTMTFLDDPPDEEDLEPHVKVTFTVEEGPVTSVTSIRLLGVEDTDLGDSLQKQVVLEKGKPFETGLLTQSAQNLRAALQNQGHALVKVEERAEVDKENRTVEVSFTIEPGPVCTLGALHFQGLSEVPERLLWPEVEDLKGKTYSPSVLLKMEKRLFALDVFDSVSVTPRSGLDADGTLPLDIQVVEGKPQHIKVGPGIGFEPNRFEGRVTALYTHKNLFGNLTRLDLRTVVGYATLPLPWEPKEHGPVLKIEPTFKKKGWLEPKLVWTLQPSFELNVDEGYKFAAPKFRLGVSRWLFGFTLAEASYNIHFVDFFETSSVLNQNDTLLGRDFRDPYLVSFLEFAYHLYFTDDVFEPTNGAVFGVTWDSAGTIVGGQFDFHKVTPELKAYWTVFSHLMVAARAQTGWIFPYAWRPGTPIQMKFYLGGADTVRGWGLKRLSPRVKSCDADGTNCSTMPVGGDTHIMANLELRFMVIKNLYLVPFLDMGDVQPGEVQYRPNEWNYSTGGGVRYASPIGKFRLDFGYRLNDQDRFSGERDWAIHLSLGEAF